MRKLVLVCLASVAIAVSVVGVTTYDKDAFMDVDNTMNINA